MPALFYFLGAHAGPCALLPPPPSQALEGQTDCLPGGRNSLQGLLEPSLDPGQPFPLSKAPLGVTAPCPSPRCYFAAAHLAWGWESGRWLATGMWPPSGSGSTWPWAGLQLAVWAAIEASSRGGPGQSF